MTENDLSDVMGNKSYEEPTDMKIEKIIGTKEAFLKMISERVVYKKLGVSSATVCSWKRCLNGKDGRGKTVSLDKMEYMLIKGGWNVFQEKVWNK